MALQKLIIGKKGEEMMYHKISSMFIDNEEKKVKVIMAGYTSALYREKEKMSLLQDELYFSLVETLQTLLKDPESSQEDIDQIQAQIAIPYSLDRTSIKKDEFEFDINDFPTEISLAYERVKKLETYADAIDC